ncbi:hypothetical protein [Aestuariicoccus sp. MJ-SS9]|uniref:hypothetical protein n=1 Tax=Aestuariicoccus sp. MJ-SS9 TaxID=3079855 RepID=UPI0029134268|nr:hypothetical protein [Aestuariicoccus sp. MJ-SS9]MDU8911302.1 hypothetical protein [Aestuariicoccus sp. MJ-SS9]
MIAADFADRGWQIVPGPTRPTRYQVMGERSSGTNFVKRLLGRNTSLRPCEDLGWKHGFAQMTAIPEDMAVICVVRHAAPWALSMHAKPWHCPPAMQRLAFSDFIRAEWATIADRPRYFPQVAQLGGVGRPLQHDRDPLTGRAYANLFALRRAKLTGLLSYFQRGSALIFTRLEAVQTAPEAFLSDVEAGFGLEPREGPYRPVVKRLGSKFLPAVDARPPTPSAMAEADADFMRGALDLEMETALGFRYD